MNNKNLPLVESIAVPDTFISGASDIEDLGGGVYRFTFYALQRSCITGTTERVIVSKHICSWEVASQICNLGLHSLNRRPAFVEVRPFGVIAH